jgi:hypothetical protein
MELYGNNDIEIVKNKYELEKVQLKSKYGELACDFVKTKFSWSWFLENDDS